jgi:hypothetical protein
MRGFLAVVSCALALWLTVPESGLAGERGHYVNGVEGIKAATLPPPGLYYRLYNVFYTADGIRDPQGEEALFDFDQSVYAMVNRFIWITSIKILGADFGADVIIPLIYTDLEIKGMPVPPFDIEDDQFGLGDIVFEPIVLSWHGARHDASFGVALYAPTGEYDKNDPASPGLDMWTLMFTLGGTYYLDGEKTWSASILGRYEAHSEKDDLDVDPGDDFHFEWGIGKRLARVWEVGLAGYCHWQVTDDRGSDVLWEKNDHDRVYAMGPEISVFIPSITSFLSLRTQWEFEAKDRPEGNLTSLTFTKRF